MKASGGGIRVLHWNSDDLREIMPGSVFMKHAYGKDMSVALFRVISPDGSVAPISRHFHGEEVNYIIKGSGSINGERFEAGDILMIPAGVEHGSDVPMIESDKDVILLSVITPPRRVYGDEDDPENPWAGG